MIYDKPGKSHTGETLRLALETAKQRGITHVVVASYTGDTARHLIGEKDVQVVCVTGAYGSRAEGENAMGDDIRAELINRVA